jgi:FMN phosphatase YigB (HAD superfamily)
MSTAIVALDLGGVIADVAHARCAALLGRTWAECEGAFFDEGLHDALTIGAVDGDAFVRAAAARLGEDEARVREAWAAVVDITAEGRQVVVDLLARGHRVHLWSNTDPVHLARMLAQLPAGVLADTASYRVGAMKPDAAFFARAAAHGAPALFLDDRLDIITAAQAAGVTARQCIGAAQARALLREASLL